MRIITKTVWILSLVSLFTDMASEMLYPVMPLFLKSIGYTALFIGILEGVAEAIAGLTKSYFGKRSDALGKWLPFVQLGYGLSAISKPMLALFSFWWWIFISRTTDRLGKGIRTGARDAMLSDECLPGTRGRVFGFHRSMDTLGAVLGPALALIYLYYYPENYRTLFIIAFVPGLLSIACTLILKEKKIKPSSRKEITTAGIFSFTSYWKSSPVSYKKLSAGLLLFALINSSDVFLLLKMKETGHDDTVIIAVYIFYNLVYALLSYPMGMLADRIGLKYIMLGGLLVFSIVYTGFALSNSLLAFFLLFALYGLYTAATEGISKAWISSLVPAGETASALGTFSGFQSICTLFASSFCGLLWFQFGAVATLLISAAVALIVIFYISLMVKKDNTNL